MSLLYPQFLWLLLPAGMLLILFKPRSLRTMVHSLILLLLILSLSRPQMREGVQKESLDTRDILIAVDVSYSMRAEDLSPNRYGYAKAVIEALLEKDIKDNIMLIAFTSNPLLLSPPTTDHRVVHTALKSLDLNNILTRGTSLKRLFEKIASFKKVHRELILITDGGEERHLSPLTEALGSTDTHLTVLALGTPKGSTVPKEDGTMLRDKENNLVISRINPLLKSLSNALGGTYLQASGSAEKTANAILNTLSGTTQQKVMKEHTTYTELYQLPLFLATLLFMMLHTRYFRYLLLFFALFGMQLQASFLDGVRIEAAYSRYEAKEYNAAKEILSAVDTPSLQQQFALANTYYRLHRYKKAVTLYQNIRSTNVKTKQQLYYNIANAYVMLGAYDKARIYYTKTLQLGEDADAVHNLMLVIQLHNRHANTGISHPKSQGGEQDIKSQPNGNNSQTQREEQPGSGSGGKKAQKSTKKERAPKRLKPDESTQPHPLSSKVYELINKGYIHETQPW